jgi:pyrroloquinoline quinone biosynthesis protein B
MQIILLGTAAGGGFPQWNCNCANCRKARAGARGVKSRTQSAVAISADGRDWFLLNASPDLRIQFDRFPPLHPPANARRGSRVHGVLLTNADLDHTLGLLLMREGERMRIHGMPNVRQALTAGISIDPVLKSFCGAEWIKPPRKLAPLLRRDGSKSGLLYHAIALSGKPPRFVKGRHTFALGHSIGFRIVDERTGGSLVFLPDVAGFDEEVVQAMSTCDVLLFDGTFWSENEMRKMGVGHAPAKSMGHVPISGPKGSLKRLAALPVKRKIYIHINNTNPILQATSSEFAAVQAAGMEVGHDGMKILI